ncbi:PREDICTED: SCF ubiquitin ligase complex protein SKP1a-like isoform X1 [Brassica oleracea var. oleracea]|uniref:SCF ubiquitin ligase complex protein SKP1a-like isoform X1 n=1 Tax=Brassica oleracea var. oleracea TaxID=109376 RepID=UPI0006A71ED7|nr:PREDICTED: SCF ubiquitin ligase complex protein SKP1a-like isoform X1 [Brassica oleracea var. oleracea]XP_013602523.1 PREDICTED: SCF ubiquitin ligase complex protein SKP1a-like isoform X1 [Brassica oleracea var. oleracea]XP_013602524.1 PREDICTED: SCF ubiquitin ligase complex protein SKP1a-like isoform X1 [Brassica oleracea var. oleracea]
MSSVYERKPKTSWRKDNRWKRMHHSRRRKAPVATAKWKRRMKAVKDEDKAIDDGGEDREKRSLMDSGTKLMPVTRIFMETPRTLSSRIGTPSSSKLISLCFSISSWTVAYMIIDKIPEDMCTNIKNDYTPEEETEVRKEHGPSSDFWSLVV